MRPPAVPAGRPSPRRLDARPRLQPMVCLVTPARPSPFAARPHVLRLRHHARCNDPSDSQICGVGRASAAVMASTRWVRSRMRHALGSCTTSTSQEGSSVRAPSSSTGRQRGYASIEARPRRAARTPYSRMGGSRSQRLDTVPAQLCAATMEVAVQRWEHKFIIRRFAVSGGPSFVWGHDEKDKRDAGELTTGLGEEGGNAWAWRQCRRKVPVPPRCRSRSGVARGAEIQAFAASGPPVSRATQNGSGLVALTRRSTS